MKTRVDVRMLRDGTRWCGVATVTAPGLRAPIDLYAEGDARDLYKALSNAATTAGKEAAARASASTRSSVRHRVLGLVHGYLSDTDTVPAEMRRRMCTALEATDRACGIVQQSRTGNVDASRALANIFDRAQRGDRNAARSAKLLLEARSLVDDGRCSIALRAVPSTSPSAGPARQLPGKIAGMDEAPEHDLKDALARLTLASRLLAMGSVASIPWNSTPYPVDFHGTSALQNFQPPFAAY